MSSECVFSTVIVGKEQRFLQAGSLLSLDCVVRHTKNPPPAVLWYKNGELLDYDSPRGGIAIQLEKTGAQTSSHLLLSAMRLSDAGNYTCAPVDAPAATVTVHVYSGEWDCDEWDCGEWDCDVWECDEWDCDEWDCDEWDCGE
ncbi:hypothetical protein HAZT_HAZT004451 [Hyalella azteca]|uniref:Ig-like domain-containing protein n=1 Tax=Hyalella azteca TaxID=294128 RepID=A0A6A0H7G9_HYAAZ|nr:hypothetical protein HAZT_HAZT004451 [Hyalella azteca]